MADHQDTKPVEPGRRPTARRHHYLPQTYLAGFTDIGTKEGRFFVRDVQTGRGFPTSPLNVGAERDFNVIDSDDHPPDALEQAMSQFETSLAESLRRVIANRTFPSPEDLNYLLNLVSLVAIRNPRMRENMENALRREAEVIGDLLVSDPAIYASQMRKAREAGYIRNERDVPFEEMRDFIRDKSRYDIEVPTAGHHPREFRAHDKLLKVLGQRTWSIMLAEAPAHFVCSDHPVTLVPTKPGLSGPIGYGTPHTAVLFPISSDLALHGQMDPPFIKPVVTLSRENVARANGQTMRYASRQVYSRSPSFLAFGRGGVHEVTVAPDART